MPTETPTASEEIVSLLEDTLCLLVNHPDDLRVVAHNSGALLIVEINASSEDIGQIVGKSGKNIRAIREVFMALATRAGLRIFIEVNDPPNSRFHRERTKLGHSMGGSFGCEDFEGESRCQKE
jgi:predicted RNA-binding protein YlqC (UPF0109 family)